MSEQKITASARVKLTIEVDLGQPWSPTETAENIFKAAKDEAINSIATRLTRERYRIIGEPVVTAIFCPSAT